MGLEIGQVVRFFFVPEAALAVVFLVLFALDFIWGIYLYRKCKGKLAEFKETVKEEYEKVAKKMSPEEYIKKETEKLSADENTLDGIPNVFVSMGILATFIGLGVAIQGAADLLSDEKLELAKLTAVLGVIAFKFQTSVWGIAFSLIFRRFAVDGYFAFKQQTVDYVRELLYESERDSIKTLLENQSKFFADMFNWQQNESEKRRQEEANNHASVISAISKFEENQREFYQKCNEGLIATINAQRTAVIKNMAALSETVARENDKAVKCVEAFALSHKNLNAKLFAEVRDRFNELYQKLEGMEAKKIELIERLTDSAEKFTAAEKDFEKTVNVLSFNIEIFKTELQDTFKDEFDRMRKVSASLSKSQGAQIERVKDEQTANLVEIVHGLDAMHQKFYQDAKRAATDMQRIIVDKTEDALKEIHHEYLREAKLIRETAEQTKEAVNTASAVLKNISSEVLANNKKFIDAHNQTFESVNESMDKVAEAARASSEEMNKIIKSAQSVIQSLKNTQEETAENLKETQAKNSRQFVASMAETTENLTNIIDKLYARQQEDREASLAALFKIEETLQASQDLQNSKRLTLALNSLTRELSERRKENEAHKEEGIKKYDR